MKLLEGKVAIVTGAARGIGEAIAIKFAEHGANVAFTYVSDSSAEKASALETKLQGMGMKAKNGVIINMSSIIGEMGNAGQTSYAASKAGVIGFTKSVAKELGSRNIRCNAIAPGFVETDMTSYLKQGDAADKYKAGIPLGRFASGEEIANTALFLESDWGNYITGQTISVCGGRNI